MNDSCPLCKKRVLSHSHFIMCAHCKLPCHIRCLHDVAPSDELFANRDANIWLCPICIESVLPFSHIFEDADFLNAIADLQSTTIPISFTDLDDKIFNPFELNDDERILPLVDIDPDLNFFNTIDGFATNCNYHFQDSFVKECKHLNIKENSLSLLHQNIRSLPRNFTNFESYLSTLNLDFSIIGLTETWVNDNTYSLYDLEGYSSSFKYRTNRSGGGVSLFIKNGINFNVREDLSVVSQHMECIFIEIEKSVFKTSKDVLVGVIYRPPDNSVNVFNELFTDLLMRIDVKKYCCYFMGDYNINILNSDNHPPTASFIDILFENNLYPTITKPTRVTDKTATLIDNIYSNIKPDNTKFSGILYSDLTDHFPVFYIEYENTRENKIEYIARRDFSEHNKSKFKQKLSSTNWDHVLLCTDPSDAFQEFHSKFVAMYSDCFPMQSIKVGYNTRKPWLTHGLKTSIKRKNHLYYRMKKHPSEQNRSAYKQFRTRLNYILRKSERDYYANYLNANRNNLRKTWSVLKQIVNKNSRSKTPEYFVINNKKVSDKKDIAISFNNYFTNIGPNLSKNIPPSQNTHMDNMPERQTNSIFIKPVIEKEVENLIKSLKTTAAGWDSISSNIVKSMYNSFITPLTHVLNLSITQGVFPNCMKIAKVLPLFKSGDKTNILNYRPISILPVFSKILERLMYNRLLVFIDKHGLLYRNQFGFRTKHSTALALTVLVDKITNTFDTQDHMVGVFLDFSKAFDTVDHHILLDKLAHYGIRGLALQWITSYLTSRVQYVCFDNICSDRESIVCGVPQGSILGPLLFLLYINDISNVSDKVFSILFADDSNVFCTGKNIYEVINNMNRELNKIIIWLHTNKLTLNVDKSNYIIFSRQKITTHNDIKIDNTTLKRIYETKFLGVYIDAKLSWKTHVSYIKNKISKGIGILCKARKSLTTDALVTLYYSFIYPYLSYCLEIWGACYTTYLNALFLQQKRILRIITSSEWRASTTPIFKSLKILSITKLYTYRILLFWFKYENNMLPESIYGIFIRRNEIHSHNTRHNTMFHIPHISTEISRHSFVYNAIKIYNTNYTKCNFNVKLNCFKKNVKEFLLQS